MTLRRLENLPPRRLSESEMTWLKNRTHDHRPEVKSLACMVYAERFPRQARNQKKQELSIQALTLYIDGDICDPYGDPMYIKESYQVSRTPPTVVRTQEDDTPQVMESPPKILAKLLKRTVHTLEIFWWGANHCGPADAELEEEAPLWNVHHPVELWHLRVAAYCRTSTKLKAQHCSQYRGFLLNTSSNGAYLAFVPFCKMRWIRILAFYPYLPYNMFTSFRQPTQNAVRTDEFFL